MLHAIKILDDMDRYQNSKAFDTLGALGRFIYADFVSREVNRLLKARCPGCADVSKSLNHLCVDANPTMDPFVLHLYVTATEGVNLESVKVVYHRAREYLRLDGEGRNPEKDFGLIVKRCFVRWFVSDFGSMKEDLSVPSDLEEAVSLAFKDSKLQRDSVPKLSW